MKILHIVGLAHGGVGEHILSLAKGCDPRRFAPTVAMAGESSMRPQFERSGIRVLPLVLDHFGGVRRNVLAFRQLAGILRREQFDIIQTHTSVAGALGRVAAKMFTRTPVVHMLHAFAGHPRRSGLFRRSSALIERGLDRCTDCYIAGSRAMMQRGLSQRIFAAHKVVFISNGIDLTRLDGDENSEAATDGPSSSNGQGNVTVGFLGRLEQQKGVAYLIRAAAIVRRQNHRIRFVIAGDGTLRPQLERLAEELQVSDAIEFVGWKHDVARFLKPIDILAMPSLWEAFGLSAAEGMAMGKPVIASRVEGLPEVVDEGRTGLLVPPADPEALARAIVDLAGNPALRQAMGKQGRARVERLFTLDLMISRHEEFYERLVGGDMVTRAVAERSASHAEDTVFSLAD